MGVMQEFLRGAFRAQHGQLDRAVQDLTPEQLHWIPPDSKANHIGFTLWHYVRTEDNIVQFVLQDRKPTVWLDGGYHERFSLHKAAQGTGMTVEDAQALRLPALNDWLAYQRSVWEATDAYVASLSDEALERRFTVRPFGEISTRQALSQVCLTHGHAHLGEICLLRVLQGLESTMV